MSSQYEAKVDPNETRIWPLKNYVCAWLVHAFTMTGLIWVLLSAYSLYEGHIKMMWLWLGIALIVDAADGPLARKAKVAEVVPWFSGVMLDNLVDYLTWTFLPALFMARYLNFGSGLAAMLAAIIVLTSSMFCYANTKMKSSDWYFVGFPAAWNIVAVIIWLFPLPLWCNWVIVIIFATLALIPWKWIHPFRVRELRVFNATAAVVWVITTSAMVYTHPEVPLWLLLPWGIAGIWLLVVGAIRTWRDRPILAD